MAIEDRKGLYSQIEASRGSKVILYATSDRPNMEAQIANDAFDYFVHHLDKIWPSTKLTLILHTAGGDSAAAWRLINLLRIFCDDLEVIVPNRAHSAGTLISLGANRVLMTKQATLGPIDPSLSGPLAPAVPNNPHQRVPVSVEAVQGFIDLARNEMGIRDDLALANVLINLSQQVHPLVLGQIFRSRNQIRSLAEGLLDNHGIKPEDKSKIVDFLCSESGSHDRTINRREARELGLVIENPSQELYELVNKVYENIAEDMQLRSKFDPMSLLKGANQVNFSCQRVLIESVTGGSTQRVTNGEIRLVTAQQSPGPGLPPISVSGTEVRVTYEGWEQK
ncbi:SDH family Clp fold serine proteinase [Pelagibacterium limicola]|uniref:SDH family Clp fold serine proteinase n=1 Tax=Pelagibacterium limicola TaxID=2791022 RepID=UPI0018AFCED7|nr:serine protease [Pelagibacterium limicola]